MPFQTTKDLIESIHDYHAALEDLFGRRASETVDETSGRMLRYLHERERRSREIVGEIEREGEPRVLRRWFGFTATPVRPAGEDEVQPNMEVDQLLALAMSLQNQLVAYCRRLAEAAPITAVQDLFLGIARFEEHGLHLLTSASVEMSLP